MSAIDAATADFIIMLLKKNQELRKRLSVYEH